MFEVRALGGHGGGVNSHLGYFLQHLPAKTSFFVSEWLTKLLILKHVLNNHQPRVIGVFHLALHRHVRSNSGA